MSIKRQRWLKFQVNESRFDGKNCLNAIEQHAINKDAISLISLPYISILHVCCGCNINVLKL